MPQMQIPAKLKPFLTKKKRYKIAFGGRGGAKSQGFVDSGLFFSQTQGEKIGFFREYQNSIKDSVYSLVVSEIERLNLEGFEVQKSAIYNNEGGELSFYGIARNIFNVKSMHGYNKFMIEEAQFLSDESIKILTPTLREKDSEIWMALNPISSADPVSKRFLEPYMKELLKTGYYEDDLHIIVWINYYDNPWFPDVLEKDRLFDLENLPRSLYNHIWLGHYNDTVEGSIIPTEWFESAVDAHKKLGFEPVGLKILSHDPSDEGADDKALVLRHGSVILDVDTLTTLDANDGCDWAIDRSISDQADLFTWDCDGLGISLKRQVRKALEGKRIDYQMFKGSESPDRPDQIYEGPGDLESKSKTDKQKQRTNKQTFRNKRAQHYWMLRDRFYQTHRAVTKNEYINPDTMISISSGIKNIGQLRSEVCRIPKKHNGNGLIQIMSKEEMKKIKIASPNMADSLMMSMLVPENKADSKDIQFTSLWG